RRSSSLSQSEKEKISSWIANHRLPKSQPELFDHVSASQLRALGCTLPTLDGTIPPPPCRRSMLDFSNGSLLSPGHSLVFCNPPAPERELDVDATVRLLPPPAPFVRRMWASGKFEFRSPLRVGDNIRAERAISKIEAKRLDSDNPMIIVEQTIDTKLQPVESKNSNRHNIGSVDDVCISETRSHVYVPLTNDRRVRTFSDLSQPDFSFTYTPTDTTLFRFSALTFNAHRIHLDKEYSQNVERLPERLVHGPMTALMLMEAVEHNRPPNLRIATFEYRATNQLFVNRPITVNGTKLKEKNEDEGKDENVMKLRVWAQSDGVVGMVGEVYLV
ncbi:hypothetical protein K439DRAFT_1286205, partial [Ramaria rubella]